MHEMSLAESVLQLIEDAAVREGFRHVRSITLEIGRLSAVEPDAMRFCFDAVIRGSIAEGASLEIVEQPGGGWCAQCGEQVEVDDRIAQCPKCGGFQVTLNRGTDMKLKALEVEG